MQHRRSDRPIRVLVGKAGLDGHDRGAKAVAFALRNQGFEVIYTGLRRSPEMIVNAALQEDVDVIGISLLSGAHIEVMERICQLLRDQDADDVLVVLGGNVPDRDRPRLGEIGVAAVFPAGSTFDAIGEWIRENVARRYAVREEEMST